MINKVKTKLGDQVWTDVSCVDLCLMSTIVEKNTTRRKKIVVWILQKSQP